MRVSRAPNAVRKSRNSSLKSLYDRAKLVNIKHQREDWLRYTIEYGAYTFLVLVVYFVLVGLPLWKGAVYWLYWIMQHKLIFQGGWAIFICMLIWYVCHCHLPCSRLTAARVRPQVLLLPPSHPV